MYTTRHFFGIIHLSSFHVHAQAATTAVHTTSGDSLPDVMLVDVADVAGENWVHAFFVRDLHAVANRRSSLGLGPIHCGGKRVLCLRAIIAKEVMRVIASHCCAKRTRFWYSLPLLCSLATALSK